MSQAKQPVRQEYSTTHKKQKNVWQMKEQGKNLQDQINKYEIGNLPEKQFRVMIVKIPKSRKQNGENTSNI